MLNSEFWLVSLALVEERFLEKWRPHLEPDLLSKGTLQFILHCSIFHWDSFKQLLDRPALLSYLTEAEDEERDMVLEAYDALSRTYKVTDSSRQKVWDIAINWLQSRLVGMSIDKAAGELSRGQREEAFTTLLSVKEATGKEVDPPLSMDPEELSGILANRPDESDAIPTGLPEFDERWGGGIYPGNFGIILAPTNVGKSMLLCFLAANAYLCNKRVLYFTYELSKLQVFERILGALFRCPVSEFGDSPGRRLLDLRNLYGLDRASLDVDNGLDKVADLVALLKETPYDLVLLDSADDMRPVGQHQNTYTALGEIYTDIHINVCQRLGKPVWTSTQASKEALEKADYNLKRMGDSFKKAQRAHLILALSQTAGDLTSSYDPLLGIRVLKDTLHGTRGKGWRYSCKFPIERGEGYPQLRLYEEAKQI